MSAEVKARIDTPNLGEALAVDQDGSFRRDVMAYLDDWKSRLKGYQDAGVSKQDFDGLASLSASVETAQRVIEFFVKLPPHSAE